LTTDPADLLPSKKKAPKKTGKRGITPLDPVKDFDTPVKKDPEKQLEELDKPPVKKGSLLIEQPDTPTVANGRMKVFYDKPHFSKYKDVVLIALQCTVPLTEKHLSLLPKIVADGYHDVNKKGRSRINLKDLPNQFVQFFLESDRKTASLTLKAAKIIGANLAVIQRKGEGSARKVIRFAFRFQTEDSDTINTFATKNLANDFWIEMENTQDDLWDEDEEKEK